MPNTFLDAYFKGAEMKQRQDLQAKELAQQQAQMFQQGQYQQQQVGLQQQQLGLQQAAQATAAQQWQQEQERQRREHAYAQQVQVMGLVGQGAIKATPRSFVPGVIGMQQPRTDGAMDLGDLGMFRPTTGLERGQEAIQLKGLQDTAEARTKLTQFSQYLNLADAAGYKMDPALRGKLLMANMMPNSNAVGILNDAPNSFGEAGAQALKLWGENLTKKVIAAGPGKAFDPDTLKEMRNFNEMREMFEGKPSSANPAGVVTNADEERRASRTAKVATDILARAGLNPSSANFGDQLENLKHQITSSIDTADFSYGTLDKILADYITTHKRPNILDNATASPAVPITR